MHHRSEWKADYIIIDYNYADRIYRKYRLEETALRLEDECRRAGIDCHTAF